MKSPPMERRLLEDIRVGASFQFTRTFTEADAALFIGATWDVSPYHTNDLFCKDSIVGRRCLPGLLTASMFTHLGGLCAFLAERMDFAFLAPVYAGETVTATATIREYDAGRGKVVLECVSTTADGRPVLRGTIWGYPGRFAPAT
jgi:acyl dehydratase